MYLMFFNNQSLLEDQLEHLLNLVTSWFMVVVIITTAVALIVRATPKDRAFAIVFSAILLLCMCSSFALSLMDEELEGLVVGAWVLLALSVASIALWSQRRGYREISWVFHIATGLFPALTLVIQPGYLSAVLDSKVTSVENLDILVLVCELGLFATAFFAIGRRWSVPQRTDAN